MLHTRTGPTTPLIFDGHNDQLSLLEAQTTTDPTRLFRHNPSAAIDLEAARRGGFAGGFFAVWVASPGSGGTDLSAMSSGRYDVPLPQPVPLATARASADRQADILDALEAANLVVVCRTGAAVEAALAQGRVAAVFHMEGAEAIDEDLTALDHFYARGLRSLGPVWSRTNAFGHGVPFRFPSLPDTGPGLTEAGKRLIKRCNALGIVVDVSHLTEQGFWDVAHLTDAPIVATHSNPHALCRTARNLTDQQLAAIAESGGMVGLNFATAFLRADGRMVPEVPLETVLRHLDYLLEQLGEDGVGLGSDYDGAVVPAELSSVAGLPTLRSAMLRRGYGEALMTKLCHGNWISLLKRTLKTPA